MLEPRPHLLKLAPYVLPDTSAPEGKRPLQLAQNESAMGVSPAVTAALSATIAQSHLYPDPDASALREAIAAVYRLNAAQVLCGGGSLALIALLTAAYLAPEEHVVTSEYSYLYFRTACKIADAQVVTVAEPDLTVDVDLLLAAVRPETRIVFVANPGNPTGTFVARSELVGLRQNLPDDVLLIIDEAYAEYVAPERYEPVFDLVDLGNTVVLRTFSKIYGLAGLRVGWGYFPPEVLDILLRIQRPNSVSIMAQAAAVVAIQDQGFVARVRDETAVIRERFCVALGEIGFDVRPSEGNFVLMRLGSADEATAVADYLREQAIVVRVTRAYGLADRIRVTLGTAEQMERVIGVLRDY